MPVTYEKALLADKGRLKRLVRPGAEARRTMRDKEKAAKEAATAQANLNTWGAVVALMESGLLGGPSSHYYAAGLKVVKIAKAQMQRDLKRYDAALAKVRA